MKNFFLLIIFFSSSLACNELPELGSSFDSYLNAADEKKIKFQIMQQVYSSNAVIQDAEINDYLINLGKELIEKGTIDKQEINFFILNDSSINAFAMLGNVIGVHSGLLFSANTESELASVLSHEIAHISQKHLLRLFDSQARNSYKTYFALAIAILAARSNPQLANSALTAGSASQTQDLLDYTRANEEEADRIGLQILDKSGYDPKGFIDFFNTMQKFNNFSSGPAPVFLRTHPITTERISDIQDRLKEFHYFQKENKLEFYFIKAKLKAFIGENTNIINVFQNEIRMKNYINESAAYFGLVYALLRNNQIIEARKIFDKLNDMNLSSPMIIELQANLLLKEKKFQEAFELYKSGLSQYPYYRAFIFGISNLILQLNKPDNLIIFLKSFLPFFKKDPTLHLLLSKAYSLKENFLLEHESLSDAYYYKYDLQNAISHMDMAVKTKSDNFYDQSRVEHRLKELKREFELMVN